MVQAAEMLAGFDPADHLLEIYDEKELDVAAVQEQTDALGFTVIRGWVDPRAVTEGRETLERNFDPGLDRVRGPDGYDLLKTNYQRVCIGHSGHVIRDHNTRLQRIFYNPIWEKDLYGLRDTWVRMSRFRNALMGFDRDFCIERADGGLFTASRVQHYPAGGGFLSSHKDLPYARSLKRNTGLERGMNFLLIMSKKGVDFHEGGGFVELDGEPCYYEDYFDVGDLLVYDSGNKYHGVAAIDPMETFDWTSPKGRFSGLVHLFQD